MARIALFVIVPVWIGLAGCTAIAVDPHAGFPQVAQLVAERVGREIVQTPDLEEAPPPPEAIMTWLQDGLSADEAVQIALLNNRSLQALYTRLGVAQADLVQASLLHNPVVDAGSGFPLPRGIADLAFGVALDFIDFLYVPLRKRVALARFEETMLRIAAEVLDLTWRTQTAFYRHQANEQMLELRRQVAA
ncbi:MAG: TolC family protein, partial [Candidatus Binatia bacterium]|nr:TolC family protein [Candidatus Binatia bacterium]